MDHQKWIKYWIKSSKFTKINLGNRTLPGFRALSAVIRQSALNPGTTVFTPEHRLVVF